MYYTSQGHHETDAGLERHHTHFLLVDNELHEKDKAGGWGGEIDLARRVRDSICLDLDVPLVTLLINGGVGNLEDVHDALNANGNGAAVVIIRDSGGCAQALAEFVELYRARSKATKNVDIVAVLDDFDKRLEDLLIRKKEIEITATRGIRAWTQGNGSRRSSSMGAGRAASHLWKRTQRGRR